MTASLRLRWARLGACVAGLWLALAALAGAAAQELIALPPPALVTDLTGTLDAQQRAALEQKLHAFEVAHGAQIALVMLPTTQPEDIASFGNRLGEAWKLGRKDVGDGLILIVAKNDKKMRIEVARTLEGAVPDASAKRIIREQLAPAFSRGDFYGGVNGAFDALFRLVEGEGLPPPASQARGGDAGDPLATLGPVFLVALFVGTLLRGLFGRVGALLAGAGAFGAAWWFVGLPILLAAGVGVFVARVVAAMGGGRGGPISVGGRHGGWGSGGGGWGSDGGGGGGGGGGWSSGGGGDFSGGGASGSWD